MRAQTSVLRQRSGVERLTGQLHQRVGEAPIPIAIVVAPGRFGQRLQGGAERGTSLGVEEAAQSEAAVAEGGEGQAPSVDGVLLLGEEAPLIGGIAGVRAVAEEPAHRVLLCPPEEGRLVEAGAGRRLGDRIRRLGQECQVAIADLAGPESSGTVLEPDRLLPDVKRVDRGPRRRLARVSDPLDGAGISPPLRLVAGPEADHHGGEGQLEEVDDVAQPDQLVAQSLRAEAGSGLQLEAPGSGLEYGEPCRPCCGVVDAATHIGIIPNRCTRGQGTWTSDLWLEDEL
jgi:hypothetical protein